MSLYTVIIHNEERLSYKLVDQIHVSPDPCFCIIKMVFIVIFASELVNWPQNQWVCEQNFEFISKLVIYPFVVDRFQSIP